jgi:glycerophosphoryl diester phosphodiesterase
MTTAQIIAHRGASVAERENTLAAFRRAAQMGADAVELDVRRTADLQMAIHHDAHLEDGRLICEIPAADLPDHVPLLPEALDACAGMWVNIEIKNWFEDPDYDESDRMAVAVTEHLAARGDDDRWLISSFTRHTIDACRTLRPTVRTAWLVTVVSDDKIDRIARELAGGGHTAIHPWVETLSRHCVEVCHAHGLAVNTWTCDDSARMAELLDWGIDGICTNVPDVALGVRGAGAG